MKFTTPLIQAKLLRRYKRFLADIQFDDRTEAVAHCPNPGSMMGLAEPGMTVWVEPNNDPRKKLKYGWRLVEHQSGEFSGIDTGAANRVVKEALQAKTLPGLPHFAGFRSEVPYGESSRVDFLLDGERPVFLEVKSVTLCRQTGLLEFPDSVTARGTKHLQELAQMAQSGADAILFFLVQRTDARLVSIAADIDPKYAAAFTAAQHAGVKTLPVGCAISPTGITATNPLPFVEPAKTP